MLQYKTIVKELNNGNPIVLICKEKHGDIVFLAEKQDELDRISLHIIKERYKCYYFDEKPKMPSLSEEQAALIPPGRVKDLAYEEIKNYKNQLRSWEISDKNCKILQKAVDDEDGKLAYHFLYQRQDHQYETIETEVPKRFETVGAL